MCVYLNDVVLMYQLGDCFDDIWMISAYAAIVVKQVLQRVFMREKSKTVNTFLRPPHILAAF